MTSRIRTRTTAVASKTTSLRRSTVSACGFVRFGIATSIVEAPMPQGVVRLATSDASEEYPSWSPEGRHILDEVADDRARYDLWFVRADRNAPRRIAHHASPG